MSSLAESRLLVIDGHAYAYRSFYAIRSLTSPAGAPTNAIFGFVKTLQRYRSELRPAHMAVIWDGGLAAERLALLPEYKAQRPPMPASLETQIEELGAWLRAIGIPSYSESGVEADDAIATLSRQATAVGASVLIASSDKDFMQLVSDRVGLLNPNDKDGGVWGAAQVQRKTGVAPEQIVDWLSLVGDTVDNIPGVPGVGPKTAATLLERFGTCAALYARLEEIESARLRQALANARAQVERNRQMVRLKDDLPGDFALDRFRPQAPDEAALAGLYRSWGFRGLLAEVEARACQRTLL
ncbi:MAG: hypothetical protein FJ387_00565 [Verrucomicrobia bacterium]|nr:hypothetical protein [Verrucomicrobiota bacterium]